MLRVNPQQTILFQNNKALYHLCHLQNLASHLHELTIVSLCDSAEFFVATYSLSQWYRSNEESAGVQWICCFLVFGFWFFFFLIRLGTMAGKYNGKAVAATATFSGKASMPRP